MMCMRFGIAALSAAFCIAVCGEALTAEEKARLRAERRERRLAESGGIVERDHGGRSALIASAQDRVPLDALERVAESIRRLVQIRVDVAKAADRKRQRPTEAHPAVVTVVDDTDMEETLLVAPEQNWAVVNVHALACDNPSAEVLSARVYKETWRAMAMAMGAANSMAQPCLLREIHTLRQLDRTRNMLPSPQPVNNMLDVADRLGISRIRRATYLQACQEGWAPAPTNELQRAVWDRVHSEKERGPGRALKIVP